MLPGSVPVAQLLPALARELGVLDPQNAAAGFRLVGDLGRELVDVEGLAAQGVRDGAVLELRPRGSDPPEVVHDDLADALVAVTADQVTSWTPTHSRCASLAVGAGLTTIGIVAVLATVVPDQRTVLATVLAVAVLCLGSLPWLAVTLAALAHDGLPVELDRLARSSQVAHDVLTTATTTVGLLVVLAAPATASLGRSGAALALVSCLVVLLRVRWHVAAVEVLVGLVAGVAGLVAVAGAVLWLHPTWRPAVATVALVTGGLLLVGLRTPVLPALRRRRLADLAESACLVAVLPLLVLATGAFSAAGHR